MIFFNELDQQAIDKETQKLTRLNHDLTYHKYRQDWFIVGASSVAIQEENK